MSAKTLVGWFLLLCSLLDLAVAGTPEEKEFTNKYKAAYEAKDTATLFSFLYSEHANPMVLELYRMMMINGVGDKITKIGLVDLTPNDVKKAGETMDGPGGSKMKLPLKPSKKLKISYEHKDAHGSSTSRTETLIAENDGKLVIPVPVDVK